MNLKKVTYLLTFCFLMASCKREKKMDSPSVNITAPSGLKSYNVFDTVKVTAHVSDQDGLKTVSVYIMNSANIQVLPGYQVPVSSDNMTFTVPCVLNDIHLASGNYYIVVDAYNGTNISYAYKEIYIAAAPEKRITVYAVTRTGSWLQGYALDSELHPTPCFTLPGNFAASDVNSYYQQLYLVPLDTGNMTALGVPSIFTAWTLPGINSPPTYFTNVYSYGNAAYVSFFSGFVRLYNSTGILQMQIATDTGYYPVKTLVWSNYLFVEEKAITPPDENFVVFYHATGMGFQQLALPTGSVVGMFGYDNNDLLVLGNKSSGQPYLLQYNIPANTFFEPISLPSSRLIAATQVNTNTYLLAFANQTIYQYTWSPNTLGTYINGVNASHLRYDPVNNDILVASGNAVMEYNYANASLIYSTLVADSVYDIQILYNK